MRRLTLKELSNASGLRYGERLLNGEFLIGNIVITLFYHFYDKKYLGWSKYVLFSKINRDFLWLEFNQLIKIVL